MSSAQHLREFIRERLTAAAEEIFSEVEKTIVRYEEELDAQGRMMEINWKPQKQFNRIGLELQRQSSDHQKPRVSIEEDASVTQQPCNNSRRSSHDQDEVEPQWSAENQMEPEPRLTEKEQEDPEPHWEPEHPLIKEEEEEPELLLIEHWEPESPWVKEEEEEGEEETDTSALERKQQEAEHLPTRRKQKELCRSQEVQQQSVASMETSTIQEGDFKEGGPRTEQLSCQTSPVVESKVQEGSSSTVSESQSHSDTKKMCFTCDICGRSLKNRYSLKLHYQTHTGVRSCSCQICGKSFIHNGALNVHMRTHTGEKPFSCEICGKSFSLICNLNLHKKIHTGEKPFSCVICGKAFIQYATLNAHMRTHTGEKPFSCEVCGKCFSQISHLNLHKKIHTGERPFSCKMCGKSFIQAGRLNFHIKQKHTSEN